MRKTILLFGLLFYFSCAFAQDSNTGSIAFEKLVYDFGQIEKGSDAECTFVFHNRGKLPLIVTEVKASCGCTVPVWTKEPVKPGGTGNVKVKYNTGTPGVFNKSITVYTNDKNNSVILTIKGEVIKSTKK